MYMYMHASVAKLVEHLPCMSWVRIPPEAAHFSLKRESGLSLVLLCCVVCHLHYLTTFLVIHVHIRYIERKINAYIHVCVRV